MQEINVKLVNQKISSSNIFIAQNITKKIELNMECRAKIKTSTDKADKKVLLNIEVNIGSKDDMLKVELGADSVFELEELPADYNAIAEHKLVPMAREALLNSLDDILVIMGYNKMELSKKM